MSEQRRVTFSAVPRIISFNGLALQTAQITLPGTEVVKMPTWGQIKKLTQKAEEVLHNEQLPFTPDNMAVTMVALLTVAVSIPLCHTEPATSFTYWAYVPNPLLIRPAEWDDDSVPVYTNGSRWILGIADPNSLHFLGRKAKILTLP